MKFFIYMMLLVNLVFANSLQVIKKDKVIKVGVFDSQPPFSEMVDGELVGFEINFAKELAKNLTNDKGIKVKFVPLKASQRIEFLQDNKIDLLIATMTITEDRKKMINFSDPYFFVNGAVLTKKVDKISSLDDLKNKKILVEYGTTSQKYFEEEGFDTVLCMKNSQCYQMLKDGYADGYANDNLIVLAYSVIDRELEVKLKNISKSDFIAIGVAKGNEQLLKAVNKTLKQLSKDGFFEKEFANTIYPFYKGAAEKEYFILDSKIK